jgi:hypothetical protein
MGKAKKRENPIMRIYTSLLFTVLLASTVCAQNLANFTQVGPVKFPANPSVQTTGMGRVSYMTYHPTDSSILFAVSSSGGIFKTSNEGLTWNPISDMLPPTYCASLAINPLNTQVMYLGTGDANYGYRGGLGVWKTTNGGKTWNQTSSGLGNILVSYIRMTPGDTNTLIAACYNGIYKSTNAGSSWVKKSSINTSYRDLHYQSGNSNILYAASNTMFYRSYNNGDTWIESNLNSNITCDGIKISTCPKDTSRLYCVVWKTGTNPFGGVYKSVNNGASFTLMTDTPNILGYASDGSSLNGQGAYNLAIQCDPNDANVLYVGGINIWKSLNGGATFNLNSAWGFGVHADKHGFLFSPYNTKKLYVYHDGGLDRTTNGGTNWTTMEDGLSASEFYTLGASGVYNNHILGGLQDNGMDVAVNKNFSTVRGGDWGGDFAFDAFNKELVYENGGIKRNVVTHVTGSINGNGGVYTVHPNDSNVMFEATTDIYRTQNLRANPSNSVSWSKISNFSGTTSKVGMAYAQSSSGTFYAAFIPQKLYRSTNINSSNPSFTELTNFPYKSGEQIQQVETSPKDSNVIYVVTTQSRILTSHNKGTTWTVLTKNLPALNLIKFEVDPNAQDSSMYICNAFGVYYRNRFVSNWIPFSQGLPTVSQITDMEIMNDGTSNARLHIATWGRGIWQTDLYKNSSVAPTADFKISSASNQACVNTIILLDNSTGSPLGRKWTITPSTGWSYVNTTDSLSKRAEIRFNTSGIYYISLNVYNSMGNTLKTESYLYSPITTSATCNTTTTNLGGYTIGIYKFELNTINNTSGTGQTSYEDFTCSNSTVLKANTNYTAWVTNGNAYSENSKIYIDYNNDGDFLDANELVGTIANGLSRRSCNFTTLASPPIVNKFIRLRVVSDYSSVNSSCGTLSYGQSEDYALYIDNAIPTVAIQIPTPSVNNSFTATFTTSEIVTGFDISDIYTSNAYVSNFKQIAYNIYTAYITPIENGPVNVQIIPGRLSDLAGNLNASHSVTTQYFVGFLSFTFPGLSTKDTIIQTPSGGRITSFVPFGTNTTAMVPEFTLSDSTRCYIGNIQQISGINVVDYSDTLIYEAVAKDNTLTSEYKVNVVINKNPACDLVSFGFNSPNTTGTITSNTNGGSVELTVPYGTNLSSLVAHFIISDSATAYVNSNYQLSGSSANNFSSEVTYRIVAQNTAFSKTYTVLIKITKNEACDMLTYEVASPFSIGTIIANDSLGGRIDVYVPYGTNISNLTALFTTSDSASVYVQNNLQTSGITSHDFGNTLTYQVIAQNTAFFKTYTIRVYISQNRASELLSFKIVAPPAIGIITSMDTSTGAIEVNVPNGTLLSNLIANFTASDSATVRVDSTVQQSGINANNFINEVIYIVSSQDELHSTAYSVSVKLLPNSAAELKTFGFVSPAVSGIISPSAQGGTVSVTVSTNTDVGQLIANFSLSDSAAVYVNGILQESTVSIMDYSDTVNFEVIAQDKITTNTYKIVVTKSASSLARLSNGVLKIYPNPANSELRLDAKSIMTNNHFSYQLTDALGQVIRKNERYTNDTKIDISELCTGIYYLQIIAEDGIWLARFLKD